MVTDTFHGTIFASKYANKFAVLARASNKNKLLNLVEMIGMKDQLMSNIMEIEEKYSFLKGKERFSSIIEEEKKKTVQYLKSNI